MAQAAVARPLERRLAAHRSVAWAHGLEGGLISAVVMGLFTMIAMLIMGDGFVRPLYLIGSLWYGSVTVTAAAAALGAATVLVIGALLGIVWAYIFSYIKVEPVVTGVAYGAILWALAQYVVIPAAGSFILGTSTASVPLSLTFSGAPIVVGFPLWMVLVGFLVFGASLGLFEDIADRRRLKATGVRTADRDIDVNLDDLAA